VAYKNDVNEADTVAIIKDMLAEIFGYDKYLEITSEYAIKKTFCDLAIKKDGEPYILIEVKAIGIDLKDDHTKQALDYGANAGVDWILLSNGVVWKVYKVIFSKPIETELIYEFNMTEISSRKDSDIEMIYYLSREATARSKSNNLLNSYREQKQLLSRYMIGQILTSDDIINAIKRVVRKVSPGAKVSNEEIKAVLENEVIKREIFDDERCKEAKKRIQKAARVTKSAKSPSTPKE
jgi:hypothetical protein